MRKRCGAWLRHGGILEGGVAIGLMLGTYALAGLPPHGPLLGLGFIGVVMVYGLDRSPARAPEDAFNHPARWAWQMKRRPLLQALLFIGIALACWLFFQLRPLTQGLSAAAGLLSAFYLFPILPGQHRLKAWGHAKPFVIAAGWAFGCVVLPLVEAGVGWAPWVLGLGAYRFCFILSNTTLADWPDRAGDARVGLRTFATEWPRSRLLTLALGAAALSLGCGLGLATTALYSPLLFIDLGGPLLALTVILLYRLHGRAPTARHKPWLDALVGWPAMTALAGGALIY